MRLIACAGLSILTATAFANEAVDRSREAQAQARVALKENDAGRAETLLRTASALRPMHPGLLIQLATVLAREGKAEEAIAALQRAVAIGEVLALDDNPGLAPLKNHGAFALLLTRVEQNRQALGQAKAFRTELPKGLIPEGIAVYGGTTFVASVAQGLVYRVEGSTTAFSTGALFGTFGMAVDTKRKRLWVATSRTQEHRASREAGTLGAAGVARVALGDGQVEALYPVPADGKKHVLGDVALAPDGTVYATDSLNPVIYRADERSMTMRPWLESAEFSSLQGMAFTADGRFAYVADYAIGIARIDTATRAIAWLKAPDNTSLLGIDGLYRRGCDLIATQNGVEPNRVLRLSLNAEGNAVRAADIVARALPGMSDITLGALVDDRTLRLVARSDWHSVKPDGTLPAELDDAVILDIALPAPGCAR